MIKRVMLDTNVLFSSMYNSKGTPFETFVKASNFPYQLVLCDQIIDELRRVFNRKFPEKVQYIEKFISLMHYDLITLTSEDIANKDEILIRDVDDRPIIRAARKANVDIFVTGDKDFIKSNITNPKIMKIIEFLNL